MRTIDEWRNTYPGINWDSPIPIHILRPDGVMLRVLACRVCIANEGISAQQVVEDLAGVAAFLELDEFLQHLSEKHGVKWFGPHWGAPVCQYEDQVEVPIGEPCEMCAEHFDSTSQGIMMAFWDKSFWRDYPVHLDCLMRSVLGPDAPA